MTKAILTVAVCLLFLSVLSNNCNARAITQDYGSTGVAANNADAGSREEGSRVIYLRRGALSIDVRLEGVSIGDSKTRLDYEQAARFLELYLKQATPDLVYFYDSEKRINEPAEKLLDQLKELSGEFKFHLMSCRRRQAAREVSQSIMRS